MTPNDLYFILFTAQKIKFCIRISSVNLTTFTLEILNRKYNVLIANRYFDDFLLQFAVVDMTIQFQ